MSALLRAGMRSSDKGTTGEQPFRPAVVKCDLCTLQASG